MSSAKLCPGCGKPLERINRKWYCNNRRNCKVDFVLLNRNGNIKRIVYIGPTPMGNPDSN